MDLSEEGERLAVRMKVVVGELEATRKALLETRTTEQPSESMAEFLAREGLIVRITTDEFVEELAAARARDREMRKARRLELGRKLELLTVVYMSMLNSLQLLRLQVLQKQNDEALGDVSYARKSKTGRSDVDTMLGSMEHNARDIRTWSQLLQETTTVFDESSTDFRMACMGNGLRIWLDGIAQAVNEETEFAAAQGGLYVNEETEFAAAQEEQEKQEQRVKNKVARMR